ncbi:hypothetical protein PG999_008467 [Apiospora kogelbergensis]|uniref:Uncharacterized protein n=1 Tax=Apiospora kogelbergensis TaxID=1337665 RepID=A0AAW0QIQ4_9PEZI
MRNTKFLPHEPGSIAAAAVLVAGSDLWGCDDYGSRQSNSSRESPVVPEGAEWMDDKELIRNSGQWVGGH